MANYLPKNADEMRERARLGGIRSGETRRLKRFHRILCECAAERGICVEPWRASRPRPHYPRPGGSHDTDWRCPLCHRFNHIQTHICGGCDRFAPKNGRITRAELRERAAEHRVQAMLRKHSHVPE